MSKQSYDVIILGLGGMGSAAASHLARRKCRVLGIEQFDPAHDRGSSHGHTRIIRQSYEKEAYVPLLHRAYELWEQLERDTGRSLLNLCGGLFIGTPGSEFISGSIRSAQKQGLKHEVLSSHEIRKKFPQFHPKTEDIGLLEKRAGIVYPEQAIQAHLLHAENSGAELHFQEKVTGWKVDAKGTVRVTTDKGSYEGEHLVICPGAWAPELLQDLGLPLRVERRVLHWLQPNGDMDLFDPIRCPLYIWEPKANFHVYGFPAVDGAQGGLKVAFAHAHMDATQCNPQTIERTIHPSEIIAIKETLSPLLPLIGNAKWMHSATCMYTITPDNNFRIATHPRHPQVHIACGFSGHGFKFCSVVGEILAEFVTQGNPAFSMELFEIEKGDARTVSAAE